MKSPSLWDSAEVESSTTKNTESLMGENEVQYNRGLGGNLGGKKQGLVIRGKCLCDKELGIINQEIWGVKIGVKVSEIQDK